MTTETFNHSERSGFLERLGRLSGSTTWREPTGAGYTPHVAGSISTDNAMLLALAMSRRNERDVGPEIAYSVGTGAPHQRDRVVRWLAEKLLYGTGKSGHAARRQLMAIAGQAYDLVIGTTPRVMIPRHAVPEFAVLANIGAGWLWMSMEATIERAEYALHREESRAVSA